MKKKYSMWNIAISTGIIITIYITNGLYNTL